MRRRRRLKTLRKKPQLKRKNKLPQMLKRKQILKLKPQPLRKKPQMPRKRPMPPPLRKPQKALTTCLMASLMAKTRRRVGEPQVLRGLLAKLARQEKVIAKRVELLAQISVTTLDRFKRRLKVSSIQIRALAAKYVTCVLSSRRMACC